MKKKVLIIGNSVKESALARHLSESHEVFVAPGSESVKEFATCVDIREDATKDLLEFALENAIDLTIPVSDKAINSSVVDLFMENNQLVFAPSNSAARFCFDKPAMKKLLYKLRVPTPKFGIFEKQNLVNDYIKNLKGPFVLKTNEPSSAVVLTSPNSAKGVLDTFFAQKNQKVIIEDYIYGTPFAFYAITDGYKALPFASSIVYKHSLEGEGGQLTSGMGAISPNYKISVEQEYYLMDNVIYPTLELLDREGSPYMGIIGVQGILSDDGSISILGYLPFMQDSDCASILSFINEDLYNLFEACIVGSFSDDYICISTKNIASASLVVNCKNKENKQNIINGLDLLEDTTQIDFYPSVIKNKYLEFEAQNGPVLNLTSVSSTISKAVENIYSEVACMSFNGISYRKDIGKPLNSQFFD